MYIHSLHRGAGAENVLYNLSIFLYQQKYEVVVCGMVDEQPSFEEDFRNNGIKVYRLSMDRNKLFGKLIKLIKLLFILRNEKPEIFMAWLRPAIVTGNLIARLAGVKIRIANLRGPALNKSFSKVLLDRIFSRGYTKYIAVSQSVKAIFSSREKFSAEKIAVINNGIEFSKDILKYTRQKCRAELELDKNEFIIGTIGRLYPEKNQQLLIAAAALLKNRNIKFKMFIVGDGPSEKKLKALVWNKGLQKDVIFSGWQKDVFKYLKAFDLLFFSFDVVK